MAQKKKGAGNQTAVPVTPFGRRVDELREAKGWSWSELNRQIGTELGWTDRTNNYLNKIKSGALEPSARIITALCNAFDVRMDWLVLGEPPMYRERVPTLADAPGFAEAMKAAREHHGAAVSDYIWDKVAKLPVAVSTPISASELYDMARFFERH